MDLIQAQLQYQISPIILTGGSFGSDGIPIVALLGAIPTDLSNAFGIFQPLPGGSLVEQTIGQYPFANQAVAGNAIIRQPLSLSLVMMTPPNQPGSWDVKLSVMSALKETLDNHNNAGGTFTVMTPAYTYTDLVMLALVDLSSGEMLLAQNAWRWDFQKPLISLADAAAAQNSLMSKLSALTPTSGNWTDPSNLGTPSVSSSTQTVPGIGTVTSPGTLGGSIPGISSTTPFGILGNPSGLQMPPPATAPNPTSGFPSPFVIGQ